MGLASTFSPPLTSLPPAGGIRESGASPDREAASVLARFARSDDAAFTHALVALAAKLAVVDGVPNAQEFSAFTTLFLGEAAGDTNKLKTLFMKHVSDDSSALQYARQIMDTTYGLPELHTELLERLFVLATSDATLNAAECEWLRAVAAVFHIEGEAFRAILTKQVTPTGSPYEVLGISASVSDDALRAHYMVQVQKLHPDRYQAAGATAATIAMLSDQLAAVNAAYETVCQQRAKRLRGFNPAPKNNKSARASAA